jgi:NAD(P)-dependent dehydrogenase (short-subunit alcohol dehydrogenase family)
MKKKLALVTGANRGVGEAIVRGLAAIDNFKVLLGSRSLEKGRAAASHMDGEVIPVELDLGSRELLKHQMEAILAAHGPIDVLVNNGAILEEGTTLTVTDEAFDKSLRVNTVAPLELIRMVLPGMAANGYGRIVNITSNWGSFDAGLGGPIAYSTSKAALNAITMIAARDMPQGVKINSMCPGWVRTRMGGMNAERSPDEATDTALWLATLPDDGPSGGFFRDRKRYPW